MENIQENLSRLLKRLGISLIEFCDFSLKEILVKISIQPKKKENMHNVLKKGYLKDTTLVSDDRTVKKVFLGKTN